MFTEFSWMGLEELIAYAMGKESPTSLEVELCQRLVVAVDTLQCDGLVDLVSDFQPGEELDEVETFSDA